MLALGHRVRLIPPQYVKPFVKRGKNDRADAAAICEAAGRPGMSMVTVKSAEQQAQAMVLRTRERLVRQRTQMVNALRGHAAEFGLIVARGLSRVSDLVAQAHADEAVPALAVRELGRLLRCIEMFDVEIAELDAELKQVAAEHEVASRLMGVPGIGPVGALTLAVEVDAMEFESGRHLSAWLGLVPQQRSTGGKTRLGKISKAGNERIRQLLVLGATAVLRHVKPGSRRASDWLIQMLQRKPRKLVAVALANKLARIVWALMTHGTVYRQNPAMG